MVVCSFSRNQWKRRDGSLPIEGNLKALSTEGEVNNGIHLEVWNGKGGFNAY